MTETLAAAERASAAMLRILAKANAIHAQITTLTAAIGTAREVPERDKLNALSEEVELLTL